MTKIFTSRLRLNWPYLDAVLKEVARSGEALLFV